jgi:hypothetical protein
MSAKHDLVKQADARLKVANYDVMTGELKDRNYRRNQRAKSPKLRRRSRERTKLLGSLGAASPVRTISIEERRF